MKKRTDIILKDGSPAVLKETELAKVLASENYNYIFNKKTGLFMRWGKTQRDEAPLELGVPEIADIEISTICSGLGIGCDFCYKSNLPVGEYMTLETFKKIFHNLPETITQIAFGIGNIHANPDMWDIFKYTKDHGVSANVTVNGAGISDKVADKLVEHCDAIAVSLYQKDITYDAVKKLSDRGLEQTNIHCMIAEETFEKAMMVIDDFHTDERLAGLNAVVFLSLKPKGRGKSESYTRMQVDTFKTMVDHALAKKIRFGFDSCSAPKFLNAVKDHPNFSTFEQSVESCEAGIYSSYINVEGMYFPCSFLEGVEGWEEGIDAKDKPFMQVWADKRTVDYKERTIACKGCNRACAHYDLENF